MTTQKTINVYTYDELSPKAKGRAIDHWRQGAEFYADAVTEDFERIAEILGIEIEKNGIAWSGFCSQGDGASFTGTWQYRPDAADKIREYAPQDETLHKIADELAELSTTSAKVTRNRYAHYSHEYTTSIESFTKDEEPGTEAQDKATAEVLRDLMRWLYRTLEAEYDYQMSDDAIKDSIEANEVEYDEHGDTI